jgi:ferritin-like metal-binding protein YciE
LPSLLRLKVLNMTMNNLHDVLVDLLKDTYHAEKQLIKALPQMAKAASSDDLRTAFEGHLKETEGHVDRLEQAFAMLEMKPSAKPCHGMMGLVEEGKEVIGHKKSGHDAAIDAALIAAAQKVEHYEITAYGTMVTFAETLGLTDLAELLGQTLDEEESADEKLTGIAEESINAEAAHAGDGQDDDEDENDNQTPLRRKKGSAKSTTGSPRTAR